MSEERVVVKLEIPKEYYRVLERIAEKRGYSLVTELLTSIIDSLVTGGGECPEADVKALVDELSRRLEKRLERRIVDILNPFTEKIDDVNKKLATIIELLEAGAAPAEEAATPKPPRPRPREQVEAPERRKRSAIEVLRDQGVQFYSDVAWMRAPERLFQKLEREGAIVFEAAGEKVAVDPGFWREFQRVVEETSIRDPEEAEVLLAGRLGDKAAALFRLLRRAGYAYYDADSGRWVVRLPGGR